MEIARINVGKKGLTESLLNEINLLLEKRGIVKVKLLRNSGMRENKELVVKELIERLGCRVTDVRGFVITIER
ncbi:MAG: RNA-binding protein [Archaeoglobi archaeon]|jgi:RNA-binding protein|nr:YhbY family RNA-binding protein [Archaeoglobus sp.]TDA27531.1 MAG: RNA-binding protein [Archaeoglobi archaeon]TDA28437.1 MAG: RNA-binding protein [Archaeoglobi archaeon]